MDRIKLVEYSKTLIIYHLFKCEIIKETTDKDVGKTFIPPHTHDLPQLQGKKMKQTWAFSKLVA